jgi:hypothetical protein
MSRQRCAHTGINAKDTCPVRTAAILHGLEPQKSMVDGCNFALLVLRVDVMDWIIKLKRPIRSKSVWVLCYGKNKETTISRASPFALRKPDDVLSGLSLPVVLKASDEHSAFDKAVSFIKRTGYGSYEPTVKRL